MMERNQLGRVSGAAGVLVMLGAALFAGDVKQSRPKAATGSASKPFDSGASKLAAGYAGHSFMAVYEHAILAEGRSEFETTAEYERRTRRVAGYTYAFAVRKTDHNGLTVTYDADSQTATVNLDTFPVAVGFGGGSNAQVEGFLVDRRVTDAAPVLASNAFGATVTITKKVQEFRVITLSETGPLSGGTSLVFPLPIAKASTVKPRLRVLFVGTLAEKQYPTLPVKGAKANGYDRIEATLDDREDLTSLYFILNFNLEDVWIFDQATGDIYAKFSERPDRNEMKLSIYHGEGPNAGGQMRASIIGNDRLTLTRFAQGQCDIAVSNLFDVIEFRDGTFASGRVIPHGDVRVRVVERGGGVLFDEPGDEDRTLIAKGSVLRAAESMWRAAPGGYVEVLGGDSRFEGRAPLAGFRELWKFGVTNCGWPTLE